ncbi:lysophospholipid acyltransferase LPEAT1-like isoform X1 [Gossypium australe]|uniref:Lysophospholipid acyltransferase LPEAT1-like isoform X1 n=1 Tax=Gossypium australe TaxID=47621 RepID=A0A5B6U6U2_9ROSI|nr:lysophospholipid acyltransferase LPEAT1-like isoform X1 [Gossypium australe]
MESELRGFNAKPSKTPQPDPTHDDASSRDDRPLLTSASNVLELEKKCAAYVRNDVYGAMGRGELPLMEKLQLGIAFVTLLPLRIILVMTVLVVYYLICRICTLFSVPNHGEGQEDYAHLGGWRRTVILRSGRFLSKTLLFLVGFYRINETHNGSKNSQENSKTARESKSSDFKGVSGVVTDRVRKAHQDEYAPKILLFPVVCFMFISMTEGTTTNGDYLISFKTGAFLARAPVVPVILKYPYQRFSPAWESVTGVRHVVFLLCQFVNHMEVTWLPVYYPSQLEKDDPKLYANNVRRLMASEGNLILSDIGLAEKRIYLATLNGNNSMPSVLLEGIVFCYLNVTHAWTNAKGVFFGLGCSAAALMQCVESPSSSKVSNMDECGDVNVPWLSTVFSGGHYILLSVCYLPLRIHVLLSAWTGQRGSLQFSTAAFKA